MSRRKSVWGRNAGALQRYSAAITQTLVKDPEDDWKIREKARVHSGRASRGGKNLRGGKDSTAAGGLSGTMDRD